MTQIIAVLNHKGETVMPLCNLTNGKVYCPHIAP